MNRIKIYTCNPSQAYSTSDLRIRNFFRFQIKKGFTLIELLVVTTLFVLIGILGMNFFATVLTGSGKASLINEIKQNGAYSINIVERFLRNAEKVTDATETLCQNSAEDDNITILNPDGGKTTFIFLADAGNIKIASISGGIATLPTPAPIYLTNNDVTVSLSPSPYFKCSRVAGRPDKIEISFTLEQKSPAVGVTLPQSKKAVVNFKTSVLLRNY